MKTSLPKDRDSFYNKYELFILNSRCGLGSEIIENSVYTLDLVDYAVGNVLHKLEGDVFNRSGHRVAGIDRADDYRPLEASLTVFDSG